MKGVLFQTIPEEVAQAVEHLAQRFQLPPEVIIKAAISMMIAELSSDPIRTERFMDMVKQDFNRSIDRILV